MKRPPTVRVNIICSIFIQAVKVIAERAGWQLYFVHGIIDRCAVPRFLEPGYHTIIFTKNILVAGFRSLCIACCVTHFDCWNEVEQEVQ